VESRCPHRHKEPRNANARAHPTIRPARPTERELKADNEGLLKWTLDLKPGEKRELTVKFTVEHPNELNVTGIE
jgi:uncharacterized cupredoxin-like copper-binding protein